MERLVAAAQPPTTPDLPHDDAHHDQRPSEPTPAHHLRTEDITADAERDGWSPEPSMQPSAAQTSSAARDMSLRHRHPRAHLTLSYPNDVGDVVCINGIRQDLIEDRSFLLAQAIDGNGLHLEACTPLTITPFLQYIYTAAYHLPTPSGEPWEDLPTSLLLHCQMYHLGHIYDMTDLKRLANVHIIRQCEFGCSSPDRPVDLCSAIAYLYENMREHSGVIETIVAYCVTCFVSHGLGDNIDFRKLAFDLRPFHQDLCKTSMRRRFEDNDSAQAIIRMPFQPHTRASYASRGDHRANPMFDDVYHFHGDDEDTSRKKRHLSDQHISVADGGALPSALKPQEGRACENGLLMKNEVTKDRPEPSNTRVVKPEELGMADVRNAQLFRLRQKRPPVPSPERDVVEGVASGDNFDASRAVRRGKFERTNTPVVPVPERHESAEAMNIDETSPASGKSVTLGSVPTDSTIEGSATAAKEPDVMVLSEMVSSVESIHLGHETRVRTTIRQDMPSRKPCAGREMCAESTKEELEQAKAEAEYDIIPGPAEIEDAESDSEKDLVKIEHYGKHLRTVEHTLDVWAGRDFGAPTASGWDMVW